MARWTQPSGPLCLWQCLIFGKVCYRVELTLMMWFLMFLIFDFCFLIFVKVSYRAELKPKAETAVELLHHSKDKTCRQVCSCFFSRALFLKYCFSRAFFSSSIVFLGHLFLKHCFSLAFFSRPLFFLGHFFLRQVQNYFFSCSLPPKNS